MGPRLSSDTDCAMKFIPSNKRWAALLLSLRNPSVWNETDINLRIKTRESSFFQTQMALQPTSPVILEGKQHKKLLSPALQYKGRF